MRHAWWAAALTATATAAAQAEPEAATRAAAARQTAEQSAACAPAQPFYWEVGDAGQALASGSVGSGAPTATTELAIASASKWVWGAVVAEQRGGRLSDEDVRFLTFRSGYTRFRFCRPGQTVADCQQALLNGRGQPDPATEGRFSYSGGHMQQQAVRLGLGDADRAALARAVRLALAPALGADWQFDYAQPQPAGGGRSSAAHYARFLRGLLGAQLQLGRLLGRQAVCTQTASCPGQAVNTPIPAAERWHYSLGHWVEDDPQVGDGAFSSPGAFGFYPWISADRRFYGVVAREQRSGAASGDPSDRPSIVSVDCGRQIRAAWRAGVPQP